MPNKQYLITLKRQNGCRDVYIPSLAREENTACLTASQFAESILPTILNPAQFQINFTSQPDEFGILAITCDIYAAELIQAHDSVASVVHVHETCTTDPWDLMPHLEDNNTRRAFAELRNERRFQKDVESAWSSVSRTSLKQLCDDFVSESGERLVFNLPAIATYLGLSEEELSDFMIVSPTQLGALFPKADTALNVANRAHALVLIAHMLRKLHGQSPRAASWMLRKQPEGWHHNGLSAKDCLFNGYYSQVFHHLREMTRKPERPICGVKHLCSHDFFCSSKRF